MSAAVALAGRWVRAVAVMSSTSIGGSDGDDFGTVRGQEPGRAPRTTCGVIFSGPSVTSPDG